MNSSVITFDTKGLGHCLYTEAVNLASLGTLQITRASHIEFNQTNQNWEVRTPYNQLLFSNASRAICLAWEHQHFNR
jgi:hypothetical protein